MARRGPYKQYELDTSIAVPKSTRCDRRKRCRMDHLDGYNNHDIFEEQNLNDVLFEQENIAPGVDENIEDDVHVEDDIFEDDTVGRQDLHGDSINKVEVQMDQ
ncbi:Hypothetical predicted protein, partial [Paramuricea clavata]